MSVFTFDATLPDLPIPSLEETCETLKEMLQPITSETEQQEACRMLDMLKEKDGLNLQKKLLKWKESLPNNASWLRGFWDDTYLAFREPLPINMNYVFELNDTAANLSSWALAICHVVRKLRTESLPPEETRSGYLSMDTLRNVFYTRIPMKTRDLNSSVPIAAPETISVVCNGNWYILTLCDQAGNLCSASALDAAFLEIRQNASTSPLAIGAMTAVKRDTAADLRNALSFSTANRLNLESIEKSLFTVCLDEPSKDMPFGGALVSGLAQNRFYDKSLQLISNGDKLGVNIEHSGADAGIWVYLFTQTVKYLQEPSEGNVHIRSLAWSTTPSVISAFESAENEYNAMRSKVTYEQRIISEAAKEKIKEKKCSPDAFVQMAYQYAYYKLTGTFRSIYEAVTTRAYYQGRTECIRPCTSASKEFVLCFAENSASQKELQEKFREAEKMHKESLNRCRLAHGPERHMSGLAAIAATEIERDSAAKKPEIFDSAAYKTLKYDAISTSSTTAPFIHYFGFGPVVEDGLGLGYGVKDDGLHIMLSSYGNSKISTTDFLNTLTEGIEKILSILD